MNPKLNSSQSTRLTVSKEQIIEDLRKLGLTAGDHVAVTLSLKSVGYLEGGPEEFIEALLETVGPNGTIMMNTFTRFFSVSWIPKGYIADNSTPSYTGVVPETLRKRKDALRSKHPTQSVTAVGRLAEYLTEGHDEKASPFMPYSRLAEVGGKYLCIGIGNNLVAIRHEAQYLAGLSDIVPFYKGVKYRDTQGTVKVFTLKFPGCWKTLPRLVPDLKKMQILKTGNIGQAQAFLASARELLDSMAGTLKENPTLNLCSDLTCLWCRELERRMNLFDRIENPRFFQRDNTMIKLVALANGFRLRSHNFLVFQKGTGEYLKWSKSKLVAFNVLTSLYLTFREKLHLTE